jgi:hypothetical protein
MKLYLFVPKNNLPTARKHIYLRIVEIMRDSEIRAFTNLDNSCDEYVKEFGESKETFLLNHMDAIMIDGSQPSSEVGYLVAFALSNGKPVLYLLEKGLVLDPSLRRLEKDKQITGLLKIHHYTDQAIEKLVREFLEEVAHGKILKETPNIKFTWRITASIDKYLGWKAKNSSKTKADFLRDIISEKLISKDTEYQKYLNKHPY